MNKFRSSFFMIINLAVVVLFIFTSGMGSPSQAQAQAEEIGGNVSYSWHTFYGTSGL